jgi:predicted RNA-binding protein with PUA-like domain
MDGQLGLLVVVKTSTMPRYWLMKSEPGVFSIDDLSRAKDGTTRWDGVRNFQARNFLRSEIAVGDGVLFYHSSADPPAVAGTARVVRAGYPDPSQFDPRDSHFDRDSSRDDPRWYAVDIQFESKFPREVTLPELRGARPLAEMELLRRGSRLSVQPVSAAEWKQILKMGARA